MLRGLLHRHGLAVGRRRIARLMKKLGIERFWRTVKYEEVYLKAYQTTSEARAAITRYIRFYNDMRGHQALNGQTPVVRISVTHQRLKPLNRAAQPLC
jgi:putative transposase